MCNFRNAPTENVRVMIAIWAIWQNMIYHLQTSFSIYLAHQTSNPIDNSAPNLNIFSDKNLLVLGLLLMKVIKEVLKKYFIKFDQIVCIYILNLKLILI